MERIIALSRGGTPEKAPGSVFLLCLPELDYINCISGQTLVCSGGLTGI
jgi:3-oxoacyl-[acyl-carrier protein] reductase